MPLEKSSNVANDPPGKKPARRRRGERACEFCRLRKLGCDQERPECQNCRKRSIACEYAAKPHKVRPSNAAIEKLTRENEALQAQLLEQQQQLRHQTMSKTPSALPSITTVSGNESTSLVTARDFTGATDNSIHRPSGNAPKTGSLADEFPATVGSSMGTTPQQEQVNSSDRSLLVYQKAQLMAETAKQRHLEHNHLCQSASRFTHIAAPQVNALLHMFWSRQHATGSIIYRTAFMRDMAASPPGPYFSPLLLQAMLLFSLRCSPPVTGSGVEDERLRDSIQVSSSSAITFRAEFERLLAEDNGRVMLESRITTVQALLLMSDVLFAWLDERAVAWHYLSLAVSMIIDLGMNEEQQGAKMDDFVALERLEIQRRVFWGAFILDKMQSIYQGRPPRLRHTDCTIPIQFLDEFEQFEPFRIDGFSTTPLVKETPTYGVSMMRHLCHLSVVADRILFDIYSPNRYHSSGREGSNLARNSLQAQLDRWWQSLPTQFLVQGSAQGSLPMENGDEPLPHVFSLISLYHALTILLHRPFVIDDSSLDPHTAPSSSAFQICHRAALSISAILQTYASRFCMIAPPYFLTYATYASATIHVRFAAQQKENSLPYEPLLNCLEMLSVQGRRNRATARMARVVLSLIEKLEVEVGGVVTEDGLWERKEAWPANVAALNGITGVISDNDPDAVDWASTTDFFFDVDPLVGFQALDMDFEPNLNGTL